MKCKCASVFKHVKQMIMDDQSKLRQAWEDDGHLAREIMNDLVIRIQKYLKSYKLCGCIPGQKLSKVKILVDTYEKNLKDNQANGGEYFAQETKQGAYTEILQIIYD